MVFVCGDYCVAASKYAFRFLPSSDDVNLMEFVGQAFCRRARIMIDQDRLKPCFRAEIRCFDPLETPANDRDARLSHREGLTMSEKVP